MNFYSDNCLITKVNVAALIEICVEYFVND